MLWGDCFAALALAADRTSTIKLGTGVTSTDTRHPTVVAAAFESLQELSGGRMIMGLGAGAGMGHLINEKTTPRSKIKHDVEMMRALIDGDWWDFDGRRARMMRNGAGQPPVYIAAGGPKQAALTGEIADGVILPFGTAIDALRAGIAELDPGLEASGRTIEAIDVATSAHFCVTDDPERDAARVKPFACLLAHGSGRDYLAASGIEVGDPSTLAAPYPGIAHSQDEAEAIRIASTIVSDEAAARFGQHFGLFGTAENIRERTSNLRSAGVNHLILRAYSSYRLPIDEMEQFADIVLRYR
ncbi:MAG TPA: LLM class flavin-dependent oxidoreductase, partial [Baekduia sp.]|nr:LLM class flavin-dependent oxidoreductase [Baekduia sp.]